MNMMEQIWKVRDSRGLDAYEKSFLMTLASRGDAGMFCEWKRNTDDMGMKKDRYYKSRKSLLDKKLITAREQAFGPTIYKIDEAGLVEWHATHSVTPEAGSATQNEHSATQNGRSVRPERKKNTKKNKKSNLEEEHYSSVADAPSSSTLSFDKDKDDSGVEKVGAPRLPNLPYSEEDDLIDLVVPIGQSAPIERQRTTPHSVTQNETLDWDTPPVRFRDRVIV